MAYVVNCAGKQVPNHWEPIGLKYLTYFWADNDTQIILDEADQTANKCNDFIGGALSKGDSVLVHSVKGQSRAGTVLAGWMMWRYQWSLQKTLEFLQSRRPDLNIRPNFLRQLIAYENRLMAKGVGPRTSKWTEVYENTNKFENEELLIRNTYLNAQMGPFANLVGMGKARPPRIKWADVTSSITPLATVIEPNVSKNLAATCAGIVPIMKNPKSKVSTSKSPISKKPEAAPKNKKRSDKDLTPNSKKVTLEAEASMYRGTDFSDWTAPKHLDNPVASSFIEVEGVQRALIESAKRDVSEIAKAIPVTQIINQNNVNNYFIQNPKQVQVIEYVQPAKEEVIKKTAPKKVSGVRPSSASVKRDTNPSPR